MSLTHRAPPALEARLAAVTAMALLLCAACARQVPGVGTLPRQYSTLSENGPGVAPFTRGAVNAQAVGAFQILEERDTSSFRDVHIPHDWTRFHLSFTTADSAAYVTLMDDGMVLGIYLQVPGCWDMSHYYQYGVPGGESHLYDIIASRFGHILRNCSRQDERAREHQREFQLARADFPAALRLMRAKASRVFGRDEKRCRGPSPERVPESWALRCEMD